MAAPVTPSHLPRPDFHFTGQVGRTFKDSDPAQFPQPVQPPKGAPNIVLILLDEPTNGVDAENGARLRAALQAFRGAMILVSHDDMFVSEIATRAMLLSNGRLSDARIHDHPHVHRHPHIHPLTEETHG